MEITKPSTKSRLLGLSGHLGFDRFLPGSISLSKASFAQRQQSASINKEASTDRIIVDGSMEFQNSEAFWKSCKNMNPPSAGEPGLMFSLGRGRGLHPTISVSQSPVNGAGLGLPLGSAPVHSGGVLIDALIHKALARLSIIGWEWMR
jgi:hypothetical protein